MNAIRNAWNRINRSWCNYAHPSPLWPIHGEYRCPSCFRVYRVAWEANPRGVRVDILPEGADAQVRCLPKKTMAASPCSKALSTC
jgi:hypothetical protein